VALAGSATEAAGSLWRPSGLRARPAWPAHGAGPPWQPAGLCQCPPEQKLDLSIRAAQLVGCPPGQRVVDGRVEPEQDALALAHRGSVPVLTSVQPLLIEGAGVDHLLGRLLTAQDYEQVGHHGGFPLFV